MPLTVTQASAVNTLLEYFLDITDVHEPPMRDDAYRAAMVLCAGAHKTLSAGLNQPSLQAFWKVWERKIGEASSSIVGDAERAQGHALLLAAIVAGVARWEPLRSPDLGEVCVGGMRYATHLDSSGLPELHAAILTALKKAMEARRG